MRLLCCAYPRCRKVSRGNSEQARGALTVAAPIIFLALVLAGWWLTTTLTGIEAWRLPDPLAVAHKGLALLQRPTTWRQIAVTGGEAIAGARSERSLRCHSRMRSTAGAVGRRGGTLPWSNLRCPPSQSPPFSCSGLGMASRRLSYCARSWCFSRSLYPPSSACVISIASCSKLLHLTARRAGRWPHTWSYLCRARHSGRPA